MAVAGIAPEAGLRVRELVKLAEFVLVLMAKEFVDRLIVILPVRLVADKE
jgi:hypothetical protein